MGDLIWRMVDPAVRPALKKVQRAGSAVAPLAALQILCHCERSSVFSFVRPAGRPPRVARRPGLAKIANGVFSYFHLEIKTAIFLKKSLKPNVRVSGLLARWRGCRATIRQRAGRSWDRGRGLRRTNERTNRRRKASFHGQFAGWQDSYLGERERESECKQASSQGRGRLSGLSCSETKYQETRPHKSHVRSQPSSSVLD